MLVDVHLQPMMNYAMQLPGLRFQLWKNLKTREAVWLDDTAMPAPIGIGTMKAF
jgi:hypothetical protein